jgi:hypothetical protein
MIHQNIGRLVLQRMRSEAISYADGDHARVASRIHVDVGVTDDRGVLRLQAILFEQPARALRIGLLGREAVAAIDLLKELTQPERVDNRL